MFIDCLVHLMDRLDLHIDCIIICTCGVHTCPSDIDIDSLVNDVSVDF